jgi:primosomal protein N' (replication factor Y)
MGAGSERLADQVARAWPRATVRRVDPDVVDQIDRSASPPDIYVTTWIGTKPVLRPDVSVVGVLDADALIRRPDFRSGETAYQALAAMAEWAGPADRGGRLVIQSCEPAHHSVQAVVRGDYAFWLQRELEQRAELGYPPFAELLEVSASGPRRGELIEAAATASRAAGGTVLGPVSRVDGAARGAREILVKCHDAGEVARGLRDIVSAVPQGSRLRVDVDPR